MNQNRQPATKITVSTGTLVRLLLLLLGIGFLYAIRDVLMIILVSIVIASAVDPLIRWLSKYKIPRVVSALFIYIGGISFFLAVFYFLIPPITSDFQDFFTQLPTLVESALVEFQDKLQFFSSDYITKAIESVTGNADKIFREGFGQFFNTASSLFSGIFSLGFIFVISFYLAVQDDGVANFIRIVTPREYEDYLLNLWSRTQRKIGRWLQGQLLLGLIVGVIVFIALTILQVKYALILAILSALFELIPYFGPILAAIPAIAIATIQNPLLGLLVAGIYFIVQQMENHLIYPQVVRKTVGVPPLLAIIALLIGGKLGGIMGFIVAVPTAVVLVEYFNDVVDQKRNLT
ncbi:MAG: AI-2E family transporter [bacterium]|nr:AI-2E family transporter [bacterium]